MNKAKMQKNTLNRWSETELNNLVNIFDGTHQTPNYVNDGIPFYSVEHISSNNFNDTKFISEEVYRKEIKIKKIEKGDILMTRIGDIGTAKYINWDVKASFYVTLALIKSKIDNLNTKFLAYYINSNNFQREIWGKTIHVAFPNKINLGDIGRCTVLLPPFSEQKRIVKVLETWDKAIELLDKKIEIKKNIKKGLMQRLLTGKIRLEGYSEEWKKVKLKDICKIKTGTKDVNESDPNGSFPFFTCAKENSFINTYSFDGEAILIAGNGEVGNCQYYKGKFDAYQRTYVLMDFNINIFYIFFYLQHFFKNYIISQRQMGAMPYIKLDMLKNFEIKTPSLLEEEKEIVDILSSADKEIEKLEEKRRILQDQKKYLLNNLVTGSIRTPEDI
jgi:type I restriction enzyme S subunit